MTNGNDIEKAFGQVIRELRLEQNISQEKLAELSELDRSYLSEIERGIKTISIVTLFKLSKGLNVASSKLISEMEKQILKI